MKHNKKTNEFILEKKDIKEILPARNPYTHKYHYGVVVVIGGNNPYSGAACLCSNAACRMGAGLVHLITTTSKHISLYPEVIVRTIPTNNGTIDPVCDVLFRTDISTIDAVIIGPGLVISNNFVKNTVERVLRKSDNIYVVIDAGGLVDFSVSDKLNHNVILTPHTAEIMKLHGNSRLLKLKDTEALIDTAKDTAIKMNCNVLLKGPTTIITDGNVTYYNNYGNAGMATAGTGDVLAGMIGANLAKQRRGVIKTDFLRTAALTSLIHSLAGDYYVKHNDMETLIASEITNNISNVIKLYK